MIVQDDSTSKQDILNSDHEAPGELIVTAPPATLIAPVVIHTSEPLETLEDDLKAQDNLTTNGQDQDKSQQQQHIDGHEDVDNEQPYGWVVVAAAFFVQAMVIGTVNGYGVYQDRYITNEYNTSSAFELSWVGTLNVVGMDMSGPLTGQIADYLGYRYSTFIGAIVMGVSLIATSFSTRVWQLYIFQGILYGLGASLAFFPSLSLPSQWFKRRRGLATGIAVAGGGFGGLVISPATTAMFSSIGYRWTVRTIAFLHLAIIIPASVLFKARVESGRHRAKRLKREQQDRERNSSGYDDKQHTMNVSLSNESQTTLAPKKKRIDFSALKEKRFLILVILAFFVANGYFNPYYYFPTYVQKNGATVTTASLLIGILNGSSAIGRVAMGLASDYIGDINTLLISSFCSGFSVLVVWMLAGTSIPVMAIFCVLYGFFSGSFVAIVPTVAAHLCGISRLASVTGIVYGGIAVGSLIGSPVGGALLDLSDGRDYRPMLIFVGLVMGVGTVLTLVLKLMMNPKLFGRI
ncbi:MAG: major facilitator superfamily domain-containing protein [Benniella sp.]|nr:MAG: major facilitator superfamily domain-containing protein [Benniella sp.]